MPAPVILFYSIKVVRRNLTNWHMNEIAFYIFGESCSIVYASIKICRLEKELILGVSKIYAVEISRSGEQYHVVTALVFSTPEFLS